jgi:hypothetical protein
MNTGKYSFQFPINEIRRVYSMGKGSFTLHMKQPYVRVPWNVGLDIVLACPVGSGFGPTRSHRD